MGHETREEAELVRRLEAGVDVESSPVSELLELGQLYIEPTHREDDAIRLFEAVLERDPENAVARFWLAYVLIHHLMDEDSLRRAADLLRPVLKQRGPYASAAHMLLAEVLEELGELPPQERIRLLESSVEMEPQWVYNRQSLGWAYQQAGRTRDAREQYRLALANVAAPKPEWTPSRRNFEESVTGRAADRVAERITSDLQMLDGAGERDAGPPDQRTPR